MKTWTPPFGSASLQIDAELETAKITASLTAYLSRSKRRGVVVALSGGIDSARRRPVRRALGKERVFGLLMPERDSSSGTIMLSHWPGIAGINSVLEDISATFSAARCYERRDAAIRRRSRLRRGLQVQDRTTERDRLRQLPSVLRCCHVPDGTDRHVLRPEPYLGIVAATNFKQRIRKMLEYYHADRLNYGVAGTPNRLEYDQGFFVKLGDGAADIKPIAHLYKTQVYQLAEYLGVPEEIRTGRRPPTPTPCRSPRRSSTSRFPTTRWTCACSPKTTACP